MTVVDFDSFSLGNEYGVTVDELQDEVMTHSLHMTILRGEEGEGWTRNYLALKWSPPGTELFPEGDPLKALFPNYKQDPDDLVLEAEMFLPENWEAAF
jgi:hypothetical protein